MEDSHARGRRELVPSLRHSSSICLLVEDRSRRRSVSQMLLTRSLDTTLLSRLARDQWTTRPQQWLTSFLENRTKQARAQYCWRACVQESCRGGIASWRKKQCSTTGVRAPSQSMGAAEQSRNLLSSQIRFASVILGEHSKLSWTWTTVERHPGTRTDSLNWPGPPVERHPGNLTSTDPETHPVLGPDV